MLLFLAGAGFAVGLIGLIVDFWVILPALAVASEANPVARSLPDIFVYYWSFFTHVTNLWLVLTYLSAATGWIWLGWFRRPTIMASAAAFIILVMLYFHFQLAPYIPMEGGILIASYLLHYAAPVLYLVWWALFAGHGALRWRSVPLMLLPGIAYLMLVLLRGAVVHEYPYDILDVDKAGYGGVAIGVLALLVAVAIFSLLVVLADHWLGRRAVATR